MRRRRTHPFRFREQVFFAPFCFEDAASNPGDDLVLGKVEHPYKPS